MGKVSFKWVSGAAPLLLTALLAAGSYWLAWTADMQGWSDTPKGSLTTPDYFVENFVLKKTSNTNAKHTELRGTRADHYPKLDTLAINKPRFDNVVREASHMQAMSNQGEYSNQTGVLTMTDNVWIRREPAKAEAFVIKGEHAVIDTDHEVATLKQGGTIERDNGSLITAPFMVINNLDGTLDASGRVRLEIRSKNTTTKSGKQS